MGNNCCELQQSREGELSLVKLVETPVQDPAFNQMNNAGGIKMTKLNSESTGDQQTITFGAKAPIEISRESRDLARALMKDLDGSPVEQTPDLKSFGPINFSLSPGESPGDTPTLSRPGRFPEKQASSNVNTAAGKVQVQVSESRFKRTSDAATRGVSEAKKQRTSTVRVILRNLRN